MHIVETALFQRREVFSLIPLKRLLPVTFVKTQGIALTGRVDVGQAMPPV